LLCSVAVADVVRMTSQKIAHRKITILMGKSPFLIGKSQFLMGKS
jgi:hypothetical protein